ncbi:MAG TPA: hypothetical protein VIL55_03120 [Naasia sp.]
MTVPESPTADDAALSARVAPEPGGLLALRLLLSVIYSDERNAYPITVVVDGAIVSGLVVHPAVWYRALIEQARGQDELRAADAIPGLFEGLAEHMAEAPPPDADDIETIFFGKAMVTSPRATGQMAYEEIACWQVKLSHVSAWTIGLPPSG